MFRVNLVVPRADALRPAGKVGRRAQIDRDAHLLQLRLDVVGAGAEAVGVEGRVVERDLEAHAVGIRSVSGFVEQRRGALQVHRVGVRPAV